MSRRYCLALDLKDDPLLIAEYEAHHRRVWPEILESIAAAGILTMEIYRLQTRLMMIMEVADDFSFERKADEGCPRLDHGSLGWRCFLGNKIKHPVLFPGISFLAKTKPEERKNGMLIKTILNRVHKQGNFVYGETQLVERDQGRLGLEVKIRRRSNSLPICSGCCKPRTGYDRLPERRFEFVPLWGIAVFFLYAMSRVNCPECGVKVERVPWVQGKHHLTTTYAWFLSGWAKRLSWKEVAGVFHTSWESVMRSVKMAVAWGLEHPNLDGISAIGVDEIAWGKGHQKYATLVYQIDAESKRLLRIGRKRTEATDTVTVQFKQTQRVLTNSESLALQQLLASSQVEQSHNWSEPQVEFIPGMLGTTSAESDLTLRIRWPDS